MYQCQRTDDRIDRGRLDRQRGKIAFPEVALRQLCPRLGQHRRRAVDADDPVTRLRQVGAVSPGAAGGIEHRAARQRREQRMHGVLLDQEQA
jgi:hypothetical protein